MSDAQRTTDQGVTLTDAERQLIDELAKSISKLLHVVVARRLQQFFEVIKQEMQEQS